MAWCIMRDNSPTFRSDFERITLGTEFNGVAHNLVFCRSSHDNNTGVAPARFALLEMYLVLDYQEDISL